MKPIMLGNNTLTWLEESPLTELFEARKQAIESGRQVLDLSMINPDCAPPRILLDRLLEAAVKPAQHRYSVSRGIGRLREAFADRYARKFDVRLSAEREVCVTMGTKDALIDLLLCLGNRGDTVLLGSPTYPAHISAVHIAGLKPIFFNMCRDEQQLAQEIGRVLAEHESSSQVPKIVLLNLPNNPTGFSVSAKFYEYLAEYFAKRSIWIVNDFVYGEMLFSGQMAPSVLGCPGLREFALETYSLSKIFNVPGWRIGALTGHEKAVQAVARLKSHIDYGAFLPLQTAAAAGLSSAEDLVKPTVTIYNNRHRILASILRRSGWDVPVSDAGACVWAKLPECCNQHPARVWAGKFLNQAGVFALPGEVFGPAWANWLRFSLVLPEARLIEVGEKLAGCIEACAKE